MQARLARLARRLGTLGTLATVLAGVGAGACRDAAPVPGMTIGFIEDGSAAGARARSGAELGIDEAASAGRLIGKSVTMRVARATDPAGAARAAEELIDQGVFAIIGGFDDATCDTLSLVASRRNTLFVNVGCRSDALRDARNRHVFHIESSDSSYWSAFSAMAGSGGRAPVLWHGGLQRFGAAQLNQRFTRRFGEAADAAAWAGWMAAKVLWQSARDVENTTADALIAHLESDSVEFDGHKGEALAFHRGTHQLVQPLYPPATGPSTQMLTSAITRVLAIEDAEALPAAWKAGASLILVTNEESRDVTVIHLARREVIATIPVQYRPRGVQVSPDGRWAYIATSDDAPTHASDADAIVAIDLRDGHVVSRYGAGSDPEQFAITPDGALLVAANEDAGTATITDLVTGTPLATLTVGIEPEGVAASPDGRWVYVTAETSNTVSVIDVALREVVANFLVDERPRAVAFAPDSRRAYVTNEISGTVSIVDVSRHAVVGSVRLADPRAKPVGVVVAPDSRLVYVANGHAGSLSVIDARTMAEVQTVAVGRRPWGVALDRAGRLLVTANGTSNDASLIDLATMRVIATIRTGERPWGAAITR